MRDPATWPRGRVLGRAYVVTDTEAEAANGTRPP